MTLDELRLALSRADAVWLHYDDSTKQTKLDPLQLLELLPLEPPEPLDLPDHLNDGYIDYYDTFGRER